MRNPNFSLILVADTENPMLAFKNPTIKPKPDPKTQLSFKTPIIKENPERKT